MSHFRTLMTLPAAAATAALMMSAVPATAAPVGAAPQTAAVRITPSPLLGLPLAGGCPGAGKDLEKILAMQRINWMWAPIALDGPPIGSDDAWGTPLAKVLIPNTMESFGPGMRQRYDLLPESGVHTAPGPKPQSPTACLFSGETKDGDFTVEITGVVVTIPKWLDALQPPIPAPVPKPE